MIRTKIAARVLGGLLALSSLTAPAAHAGSCAYTSAWSSSSQYSYERCQMTDLDQRRQWLNNQTPGLPNDGKMYCVPTAAVDLLTYIANHGYSWMSPGSGYYGHEAGPAQPQYNKMTNAIFQMGQVMGTSPFSGTGGNGAITGLQQWLWNNGGFGFTVSHAWASGYWSPRLNDIAGAALDGAVVEPIVGWYDGSQATGFSRDGGHALALATATRSGSNMQIGLRDPAATTASDDYFSQSGFTTETYPVQSVVAFFDGYPRAQDQLVGLGSHGFLDGYIAVYPPYALTVEKNLIHVLKPWPLLLDDGSQPLVDAAYFAANNRNVVDLAIDPALATHPYLAEGDSTVWELDALSGRSTALTTVDGARRLVIGGKERNIYVLTPSAIVSLSREGRVLGRVALSTPLADIAFDAGQDVVIGISVVGDTLFPFSAGELLPAAPIKLGQRVAEGGDISIQEDPATHAIIIHADGSAQATRVLLAAGKAPEVSTLKLEGALAPLGLTVGDHGQILMTDGGKLVEFDAQGHRNDKSAFSGLPGGARLDIRRSFDNADPRQDSDPRFRDG